jgi:hypothetical protein
VNKQELENRLIEFAATIIIVASLSWNHLVTIRSGTSQSWLGRTRAVKILFINGHLFKRIKRKLCLFKNY